MRAIAFAIDFTAHSHFVFGTVRFARFKSAFSAQAPKLRVNITAIQATLFISFSIDLSAGVSLAQCLESKRNGCEINLNLSVARPGLRTLISRFMVGNVHSIGFFYDDFPPAKPVISDEVADKRALLSLPAQMAAH